MSNLEILKNYSKDKLSGVVDFKEVIPAVYLLKDADGHIIGLYDRRNDKLIKRDFTSFEIRLGVLVLKREEVLETEASDMKPYTVLSKEYISLYDPINATFIESPNYYNEKGKYLVDDGLEDYERTCFNTADGIIFLGNNLSHMSRDFYDIITGKLFKNYFIMNPKNSGIMKLYSPKTRELTGLYDKNERVLYQCYKDVEANVYYYIKDDKKIYFNEYSTFVDVENKNTKVNNERENKMYKIERIANNEFVFVDSDTNEIKEKLILEQITDSVFLVKGPYGYILGLYDKDTDEFMECVNSSYEINGSIIILKNKMLRPISDKEVVTVDHYSLYDTNNKKLVTSNRYHDYMGDDYDFGVSKYISATIAGEYVCLFYRELENLKVDFYNMETGELITNKEDLDKTKVKQVNE